jgi:hydroxymethylpyrimidine pyrophosphatase-like HAD family hydrolase
MVIDHYPMSVEVGLEVARRLRDAMPDVWFAVETLDGFARERDYRARWDVGSELRVGELEGILDEPVVKLLARHEDLDADTLLAQAREVVGEAAELTHSSSSGLLEISAAGVSKATTLARLCDERGVDPAEVVAFGDMPNDLPMLAWAGTAYAVANAHPEVLAAVDRQAPSVLEDGVAQILEHLFARHPDAHPAVWTLPHQTRRRSGVSASKGSWGYRYWPVPWVPGCWPGCG